MPALGVNLRAVKALLPTLPIPINWRLRSKAVPPSAPHMLYGEKIRPLNEGGRGARKSFRAGTEDGGGERPESEVWPSGCEEIKVKNLQTGPPVGPRN